MKERKRIAGLVLRSWPAAIHVPNTSHSSKFEESVATLRGAVATEKRRHEIREQMEEGFLRRLGRPKLKAHATAVRYASRVLFRPWPLTFEL